MSTLENAFDACIHALEDPRRSNAEKGDARLRLRKLARHLDRLEGSGWDDLDGDVRDDFFAADEL